MVPQVFKILVDRRKRYQTALSDNDRRNKYIDVICVVGFQVIDRGYSTADGEFLHHPSGLHAVENLNDLFHLIWFRCILPLTIGPNQFIITPLVTITMSKPSIHLSRSGIGLQMSIQARKGPFNTV